MMRINPKWAEAREAEIGEHIRCGTHIDMTLAENLPIKWLIVKLSAENIPFKIYNLGAGVKRITTNVDHCPCCKKYLK